MLLVDYIWVVSHIFEKKIKNLAKDIHQLAQLRVRPMRILDGSAIIQNGSESSLVMQVNKKQYNDPILLKLNGVVHQHRVEVLSRGRWCVFLSRPTMCS